MKFNSDFRDLFSALNVEGVRYLIVRAYAVIYHTEPRHTKDIDIWVEPTKENAQRVWKALARFGAPLRDLTVADFTDPYLVYQIGVEPIRVDVMTDIEGVSFEDAWEQRVMSNYAGESIQILGKDHLIAAKRASNRPQDQLDVANLLEKSGGTRRE